MIPNQARTTTEGTLFPTALHVNHQPDHLHTLYLTSILTYRNGHKEQAVMLIRQAFEVAPTHAEAYIKLGVIMQDSGRIEEAILFFQHALAANTNKVEHLYRLSQIFIGNGYLDEAINCLRDIVRLNPNIAGIHQSLGLLYLRKGLIREAVNSFRQAISLNDKDALAHKNLGLALLAIPETQEAIGVLHRAISLDPGFSAAYSLLGGTYRSQGQLTRALEIYRLARKIFPTELEYLNDIGLIYLALKQWSKAEASFQELITLKPEIAEAHFNLGLAYQNQKRFPEAVATYRQAIEWNPANVAACNNLAQTYLQLDNETAARAWYRRVVELDPENHAARHILAALNGDTTMTAPQEYVISLFDQYSEVFDHDLVQQLDYHVPAKLRQAILDHLGAEITFANAIDLGCGTGMSGQEFRPFVARMTGVDLSGKMLAKAQDKKIYDSLINGEITKYLNSTEERFDLFIATDVFIYLGKLEPIFEAVKKRSAPGGYFAFSIETCSEDNDYLLCPSGRYAQSRSYIELLARTHGFVVECCHTTGIRKEKTSLLMGELYILKRLTLHESQTAAVMADNARPAFVPSAIPCREAAQFFLSP